MMRERSANGPEVELERPERRDFVWSAHELQRVGARVAALIADHVTALPDGPVFQPMPSELAHRLRGAPVPERGTPIDVVLDEFARDIAPYPFGNGHPGFLGWVNSPPAPPGIFAAALAAAMNPSAAGGNHAAIYVEQAVTAWLLALVGLPQSAKGLLVSGTSMAAIIALNVARFTACARIGWDVRQAGLQAGRGASVAPRLLVYRSAEAHGCHQKAIEYLGIGAANLRTVPTDRALRIDPQALEAMLDRDARAGHLPVAVIGTAGTVNTGVIDPLGELAEICQRRGVWLHVDAAYGAPAVLHPEFARELAALSRADSVALDPHKWLYVPVDAGFVAIRDAQAMRNAASLVPPYLRTDGAEDGVQGPPWFSEYGLEQTRAFRALKVWFALKTFGLEGYRDFVARDIALARDLADRVRADRALELWEPQGLSIVCFRVRPAAAAAAAAETNAGAETETDRLNRAVARRVQLGGEAFISTTLIGGQFWLRACVVNPRTRREDIDRLVAAVHRAVEELETT